MSVIESHRTAIRTKYLGPTNHRGSRIRVWRADGAYSEDPRALTVSWDHALNPAGNHAEAVRRYVEREVNDTTWVWPDGAWVVGGGREGSLAVWSPS